MVSNKNINQKIAVVSGRPYLGGIKLFEMPFAMNMIIKLKEDGYEVRLFLFERQIIDKEYELFSEKLNFEKRILKN